jgi:hypothetical protein
MVLALPVQVPFVFGAVYPPYFAAASFGFMYIVDKISLLRELTFVSSPVHVGLRFNFSIPYVQE